MKKADARPKLPLIIFLGILVLTAGCSSEKKPEAGGADGPPEQQQESRKRSDVNWATGATEPAAGDQQSAANPETSVAGSEAAYATASADSAATTSENPESQESSAAPVAADPAAGARTKVEEYQANEDYILKYIEKVEKRLETEQDSNFRAGYEEGLQQARENYVTNKQDLEAAQKELAAASKKQ